MLQSSAGQIKFVSETFLHLGTSLSDIKYYECNEEKRWTMEEEWVLANRRNAMPPNISLLGQQTLSTKNLLYVSHANVSEDKIHSLSGPLINQARQGSSLEAPSSKSPAHKVIH